MFNNFSEDVRGTEDSLLLPVLDLSGASSAELMFSLAYAAYDDDLFDRLDIQVSDDCGETWNTEYSKSGMELSGGLREQEAFVPSADQWRLQEVDLSAYAGASEVWISFVNISGWGNNLYVDDIMLSESSGDTTSPNDPTSVVSTTHPEGGWSLASVITMQWSGAEDLGGSGLAGYSVLFDEVATTQPSTTVNVPQGVDPHSFSSSVLADGLWYFHLATCDNADNCTATVHRGPYGVDTEPPSVPFELSSPDHFVGVESDNPIIQVDWTASVDDLSGMSGYGWVFTADDIWSCDQIGIGTNPTATSDPQPNGDRYFHVCATDNAGNWSAVAWIGPFVINVQDLVFQDGFESGDTNLWSATVP